MDDSAIMHDQIIEETKASPTNHNEKNITFKIQNFCIWLAFLLIALHCIVDSCYHLLLSDKISSKTETKIFISI